MSGHVDQRQHVLVRTVADPCRAEPVRLSVLCCQVGVDAPLDVHVLPGRKPLGDLYHGGQLAAEVRDYTDGDLRGARVLGQRPGPDLDEQPQTASQPAQVVKVRHGRRIGDAHLINNARWAEALPTEFHRVKCRLG